MLPFKTPFVSCHIVSHYRNKNNRHNNAIKYFQKSLEMDFSNFFYLLKFVTPPQNAPKRLPKSPQNQDFGSLKALAGCLAGLAGLSLVWGRALGSFSFRKPIFATKLRRECQNRSGTAVAAVLRMVFFKALFLSSEIGLENQTPKSLHVYSQNCVCASKITEKSQ